MPHDDDTNAASVVKLSERDSLRVLALLENPPQPNARLRAAIAALPATIDRDAKGQDTNRLKPIPRTR